MGQDPASEDSAYLLALGRRIRFLRRSRDLSQEELAAAAGLSRNFLGAVERGAHGIDVVRLVKIAAALGVDPAALVSRQDTAVGRPRE